MSERLLTLRDLSVGYAHPVCEGISAEVESGELIGLAGKNGSGKSTLIKTLLGLQPVLSGSIVFQNRRINPNDAAERRAKQMSVVFSRLNRTPPLHVFDLVALGRLPYHKRLMQLSSEEKEKVAQALELVGVSHLHNRFANELSDGQLQMVMIARAIVQDTPLILMDEPTSHLDIENQFRIFELIYKLSRETGKTFIVASHQVELLLHNASQLWWIDDGKFYAGFPEQVAYEQRIFEKLSQEQIQFDYQTGSFRFQYPKARKVNLISDGSDLAYWVKHALERNGFEVSEDSQLEVKVENETIKFNGKLMIMKELIQTINTEK